MALDINGYNDTFRAFVNFAQSKNPANEMNAVARGRLGEDGALAGHQITASNTDELHKLRRSTDDKTANDRTRAIFKNAIIEMFGGEAKIPALVKKAMMLEDYGSGRPLTARRILCVKNAIDANGTMRRRAYDERVSQFASPETRQAALDMGYREPELVRLARAVNFYAETMHCTEAEALAEVGEPGTKANRLLRYGGWFLVNAEKFADGLRLLDLFENWFADLSNAARAANDMSLHRALRNYPADSTITALNAEWEHVTPNCRLALERFVFEALAHDRHANLKATDGEAIFGAANNPATSFVCQGFGMANLNTLLQVPHDKRALVFKAFGTLCSLATNPDEARTGKRIRHFGTSNAKLITIRMLKHLDRLAELDARGKLDAANVAKTCFPELALPKRYTVKALHDAIEGLFDELAQDLDTGVPVQMIMEATGCTLAEARAAHQNGVVLPPVPYLAAAQLELDKVGTVEGARELMEGDLTRPDNYSFLSNPEQTLLGEEVGGFGVVFTGGERFIANGTQEGRAAINRIAEKIGTMCGRVHPRQTAGVMMLLSQSGCSVLRGGLKIHGIQSNEHSVVDFTITRNDATGDVHVRFSSKKELPFAFEWTATVKYDGTVATTPFTFTDAATVAAKTAAATDAIKNKLADNMLIGGRGVSNEDCAAAARKLVGLAKGDLALLRLLTENKCEAALYILKEDNLKFRHDGEIARRLEALRDNVSELRMATNGDTRTFDAVIAQLAAYNGRPVEAGALAKLIAISRKVDLAPFKGLSAASSPARLTAAMGKLLLGVLDAVYCAGLVAPNEPRGAEEVLRIYSLAIAAICARLDDDAVRGFRDALYSGNGGTMAEVLSLVASGDVTADQVDHDVQVKINKTGAALHTTVSTGLAHVLHDILGVNEYNAPPGDAPHELTEADVRPVYNALRPTVRQINPAHF